MLLESLLVVLESWLVVLVLEHLMLLESLLVVLVVELGLHLVV
jgi:hypothetical protein